MLKKNEKILLDVVLKSGANVQVYSLGRVYYNSKKKSYVKKTLYFLRWQTSESGLCSWNDHGQSYRSLRSVMKCVNEMVNASQFISFSVKKIDKKPEQLIFSYR